MSPRKPMLNWNAKMVSGPKLRVVSVMTPFTPVMIEPTAITVPVPIITPRTVNTLRTFGFADADFIRSLGHHGQHDVHNHHAAHHHEDGHDADGHGGQHARQLVP